VHASLDHLWRGRGSALPFLLLCDALAALSPSPGHDGRRGLCCIELIILVYAVDVAAFAVVLPAVSTIASDRMLPDSLTDALGLQKSAQSLGRLIGLVVGGAALGTQGWVLVLGSVLAGFSTSVKQLVGQTYRALAASEHSWSRLASVSILVMQLVAMLRLPSRGWHWV